MKSQFEPSDEGYEAKVRESFNRQEIMKTLRNAECSLTPKEISEETGLNYNTVKVRVRDMAGVGQLAGDGEGRFRLP